MGESFPTIQVQRGDVAPTEGFVFGERHSGTNLASELLRRNFPAFAHSPTDQIGPRGFKYGWKHGFPQMLAAPPTTFAVVLFRHPEPWARAMHKRPWHAVPALAKLPFDAFLRAEWQTRVDERNFGLVGDDDPRWLDELQWDRHPITGERFENLLALRNAKTAGFLSLPRRFAHCLLIRHEDLTANPEGFVAAVSAHFALPRYRAFRAIEHRRGRPQEGAGAPTSYPPLEDDDRAFLWSVLDREQESRLGYAPV